VFDGYVEAIVLIYLIIPVLRRSVWMWHICLILVT